MSHAHPHAHAHAHDGARFGRALLIGIGLNAAFVAVEAGVGWHIDSLALLADAGHNLSDVAALILAGAADWAARRPGNMRHTYGFKRGGLLAALINAVMLLAAMGWLAWEAVQRLQDPPPVDSITVVAVAALGIVVNTGTALLFMRGRHHDLNVSGAFWHMAADAAVSAGVVVAGLLAWRYGWLWADPVASLGIAILIVIGSWGLLRQSVHLLFDGVPEQVDLHEVRAALEALPGVAHVHDLHVWAMGTRDVALTAHLVMPDGHPGDALLQQATRQMHDRFRIGHVTLQVVTSPFTTACSKR